jgi:hypothetical protein
VCPRTVLVVHGLSVYRFDTDSEPFDPVAGIIYCPTMALIVASRDMWKLLKRLKGRITDPGDGHTVELQTTAQLYDKRIYHLGPRANQST